VRGRGPHEFAEDVGIQQITCRHAVAA
jgi:hypothetical protein